MLSLTMLKQILKKKTIWLSIGLIMFILIIVARGTDATRVARPFTGHDSTGILSLQITWEGLLSLEQREKSPLAYESYVLLDKTLEDFRGSLYKDDVSEMMRLNTLSHLMMVKQSRGWHLDIDEALLKRDIYQMWQRVSRDKDYDSVDFRPFTSRLSSNHYLIQAKYWDHLLQLGIEPVYKDEANNVTLLYYYVNTIGPLMFVFVPLFLAYNSVNGDYNSGVLKLLLTQSVSRPYYYLSKWLATVLSALFVVILPALSVSILFGIKNGFIVWHYPVMYMSGALTKLKPIANYVELVVKDGKQVPLGPYTFMHMAPADAYEMAFFQPHEGVELIPFILYLLLCLFILVLLVGFIVALTQMLSSIINHELISLITSSSIVCISMVIGHSYTIGEQLNVSPFNMYQIGRIVEGTQNVTVLASVLILGVSMIVCLVLGERLFRRKSIQ